MLELSHKYGVKKFIFASSAAVYGNQQGFPIKEDAPITPVSVLGADKAVGEYYCRCWNELHDLDTVILRFASVYGPSHTSHDEQGNIPDIMRKMIAGEDIVIYGDGTQTRDYIPVSEIAYVIFQVAVKNLSERILNVSSNTEISINEVLEKMAKLGHVGNIRYEKERKKDIGRLQLDNSALAQELSWNPRYSFDQTLKEAYEWHRKNVSKSADVKKESKLKKFLETAHPYIENLAIFSLLCLLYFRWDISFINTFIGVDYNYVYIAIMGFLYGKRQSMIAMALSVGLFTTVSIQQGNDIVALLYQEPYLSHMATYICIGVVTGFAIDNKDRIITDLTDELNSLKERHEFLEKVHMEATQIKDDLYGQIVNTDDSIGKVYSIVHQLDTLETENIYTTATDIARNIVNAKFATLYTVNKFETYLRLNTKVGEDSGDYPNSLKIEDYPYVKTLMSSKQVFINKAMEDNCPDMAAPIMYQGKIFAVLQVHGLPFANFTLFHENMFRIVAMFITDALIKAYLYSESVKEKKYLKNTNILIAEEFEKICQEYKRRKDLSNQSLALLKITEKPDDYEAFYQRIGSLFRAEDYVGLREDGYVYVLLINLVEGAIEKIHERLNKIDLTGEIES